MHPSNHSCFFPLEFLQFVWIFLTGWLISTESSEVIYLLRFTYSTPIHLSRGRYIFLQLLLTCLQFEVYYILQITVAVWLPSSCSLFFTCVFDFSFPSVGLCTCKGCRQSGLTFRLPKESRSGAESKVRSYIPKPEDNSRSRVHNTVQGQDSGVRCWVPIQGAIQRAKSENKAKPGSRTRK